MFDVYYCVAQQVEHSKSSLCYGLIHCSEVVLEEGDCELLPFKGKIYALSQVFSDSMFWFFFKK